jgi:ABC-2 type transport system permease protein
VTRLVRAELLKLRTVRTLLWLVLALALLVLIPLISIAAASGTVDNPADNRSVARIAAIAVVFSLLLGIIIVGAEGTNGTITQSFLVAPVRERVLAAKAFVAAALGVLLGVLAELIVLVVGVPGASLDVGQAGGVLGGVLLACAAAGALGVGVGALFHRQGPGIVVTLIWLLIAENVLSLALRNDIKYMPAHVFAASVSGEGGHEDVLSSSGGVVGAVLYAALFFAVGVVAMSRRDV